jgi:hypothetical protein
MLAPQRGEFQIIHHLHDRRTEIRLAFLPTASETP